MITEGLHQDQALRSIGAALDLMSSSGRKWSENREFGDLRGFPPASAEEKMLNHANKVHPIIDSNIPFVGAVKPRVHPFVGKYAPFVRVCGFTLVELMVTLAVVAILTLIVAPNMRPILQNNRLSTATNDFLSDINLARSEAIKRARDVRICTWNSTANPATPACDGSGDWSGGRLVWTDSNRNGVLDTDEVVRSREGLTGMTLNQLASAVDPITFDRRGLAASAIDFALCDDRGAGKGKTIRISQTGQASSSPNPASCN